MFRTKDSIDNLRSLSSHHHHHHNDHDYNKNGHRPIASSHQVLNHDEQHQPPPPLLQLPSYDSLSHFSAAQAVSSSSSSSALSSSSTSSSSNPTRKKKLPMDQLRDQVAKRQRLLSEKKERGVPNANKNPFLAMLAKKDKAQQQLQQQQLQQQQEVQQTKTQQEEEPLKSTSNETQQQQRRGIRFDLTKNTVRERHVSDEDLQNAWMSREAAALVKCNIHVVIAAYQEGTVPPPPGGGGRSHESNREDDYCIRGIEAHVDPNLGQEKIAASRSFTTRMLQQQSFLLELLGKVNQDILAKLSSVLSANAVQYATDMAAQDAHTALFIHAGLEHMLHGPHHAAAAANAEDETTPPKKTISRNNSFGTVLVGVGAQECEIGPNNNDNNSTNQNWQQHRRRSSV